MKKWEYILLYLFITINVVGFVFGILLYTYLIPKYAQYKVDQIGVDGNTIRIHKLDVGRIQNNQIPIAIDARIDAFTVFPIQGGIGDTVIDISSGGKTIASFNLPAIDFWLNEEIVFAANCSVAFTDDQLKNANDLFAMLSSPDGINDLDIYLSLNPQIYGQGIMFYSHLPLHRNLDFGHVTNALGSYFSGNNNLNQFHPLIFFGPDQDSSSQLMHSHFDANEIMVLPESLGNLEVVWTTFQILMDDISALLNTQFAFANPKYVSMSTIDEMEFYFSLEGTKAAKVTLQKLGLSNGLNSNFTIGANLTFTDSEIDPTAVQSAIENASQSYAQKRNFEFGLVGPISISGAPFVAEMTKDLKLQVTLGDLVLLAPQALGSLFNIDFSSIFNQLSQDIIGNSTITADITTDGVAASLGLNLKAFDFLKPPKNVDFPYSTSISVHGPSSKIFQTNVSPISFGIDERGVMLKTNASIIPVNTDQAATDLAKMVNPIISRNPTNSTVGIKDLLFALPGQAPFKWSQSLFGQRILNIGIPPVNMESLLLSISSPAMGTALNRIVQVANGTLDIAQLNDRPGFGASGNLKISYSKNLPAISVNVGYFNLFGTVESSNLVQLTLPNGIDFKPSTSGTTINAAAVIQRGDVLESKIQNLADALLMDGSLPSYFGLTGLVFGDSLKSNIVTFSKVILDFNTTTLQTAVRNENFVTPSLPNNFIAIKGVNLQVASSSKIAVGIEAAFENSFALNLNVGAIALNAQLQNQTILGLKTSPTLISPGTVSQIINLDLALANSNDQLQQSVGAFLQALWNKDTSITSISGVTGFTLTPTNPASSFAAIDQFANITFSTESSKVISFVNDHYQSSANSPIDLSALVPSPDLSKFGLVVDSLDFNVLPRSALSATIGLSYNNYMPITVSIPYLQLSLMIDSTPVTNVQLGGLNVGKDLAKMKLSPTFNFQSGSADKISGVISGLMAKKLSNSLAVGHLAFGSSNTDITTLISFANFDITSIVQKGFAVTFSNPIIDMSHLTPDINKLSLSASSLDLNILPNSQVAAAIGLTFNNYLPVTFSIPYIQLSALIDDEHTTDLQLKQGLSVSSTTTSLSLSPTAKFSQNIADPVANLVNGWKAGKITSNLKLGGIIIGASPTDQNDFLSKVTIDLSDYLQKSTTWNINTILDLTKLTPSSDISKFSLRAKSISVGVEPSSAISSKLNIDYSNYLPVSVNLPYLKFTAGLDSSPTVDLETNNFGITRNSGTK
ncbi:hypothetical protein HK103_003536 [Boothiomyces macroporosus]|uniref:Uncharacterized protein n=1 Tax=Boothiomyces macroporosus TaxID=261099 RepID=A0AAD5ULG4_9FUNG|nr:hypothetical protein HK103_003536 [Boothiomyces macroporosus]